MEVKIRLADPIVGTQLFSRWNHNLSDHLADDNILIPTEAKHGVMCLAIVSQVFSPSKKYSAPVPNLGQSARPATIA
jgi:hypothetical protein